MLRQEGVLGHEKDQADHLGGLRRVVYGQCVSDRKPICLADSNVLHYHDVLDDDTSALLCRTADLCIDVLVR